MLLFSQRLTHATVTPMQHITVLALPESLCSSISLPVEMLNAANDLARSRNRHYPALQIDIVSEKTGLSKTAGGLSINCTAIYKDIKKTDLLILPALWRNPSRVLQRNKALLPWIQDLAAGGALLCAVGTSSCFLAEAGLLDEKPATTHWHFCDTFAKRYPRVDLKRDYLITQAGNIYCAGSANSVADLTVHLAGRFYGQDIAKAVEGQFSPEIRRPFENHAYAQFDTSLHRDETIIDAQEWLRQHCIEEISLSDLANKLDLSPRTFNRRFKKAVGVTANSYLQNLRLNNAKELLRTSNLSITEVAARSGYQDDSYFCLRFRKLMGQTPLSYRKSVRGKLFQLI